MEHSLRTTSHVFRVQSPPKKKKKEKTKNVNRQTYMKEIRCQKREREARKGSGHQLGCLVLQSSLRKRTLPHPHHSGYQS